MSWTVKTSAYGSNNYRLAVEIKVNSQSINDNSTLLSYRVYADNTGYSSSWVAYYSRSVTINGTTVYSASNRINGYKNQTFKTGTIRIPHNSDGTKSINVSLGADIYSSSGNRKTGSETITLPRIDRGIYSVSFTRGWIDITGSKYISYEKYNSSVRVSLSYSYWSRKDNSYSKEYLITSDYSSNSEFSFSESVIDDIHNDKPDLRGATVKIFLRVYVVNNLIETITRSVELKLKVEAPSVNITSEMTGTNQSLLGSSKRGLAGIHALEISTSAQAKNGAKISAYELVYDGRKYSNKTGVFKVYPKNSGNRKVSVKVIDTRGYHYTVNDSVTILSYRKPYVTHRAYRSDGTKENPLGNIARIEGRVNIHDVKDADGKSVNQPFYKINIENVKKNSGSIFYSMSLPISESREYEIIGEDRFAITKTSGEIPLGQAPLVIGKNSAGIGTVPPSNSKGLWMQDSLLNGNPIMTYSSYSGFTAGDFEAMAERMRKDAESLSINYATLISPTTSGYGVLHVFSNKTRAVGFIQLYTWHIRRVEYNGGKWTVITVGG